MMIIAVHGNESPHGVNALTITTLYTDMHMSLSTAQQLAGSFSTEPKICKAVPFPVEPNGLL